jgi:hypothetical protein
MKHWWHGWRAVVWGRRLEVLAASVELLQRLDREYGSSYYSDRLHRAVCDKAEAAAAFKYHTEREKVTRPLVGY